MALENVSVRGTGSAANVVFSPRYNLDRASLADEHNVTYTWNVGVRGLDTGVTTASQAQ